MDRNARYGIKRAEREQIKYELNQHYDEFYQMRENLARIKGFTSGLGFTTHSAEMIKRYGTLFTAEVEGEVITGNVYLEDKEHILAWMSASKRLEVDKQKASLIGWANRMLHWEAIKYAKAKGIREFNWGGCGRRRRLLRINRALTLLNSASAAKSKLVTYIRRFIPNVTSLRNLCIIFFGLQERLHNEPCSCT